MALQRLIAQGNADAGGNIDGLTDPSWVPTVQQVFTGSLSVPDSTITAQWTLYVNGQPQLTFIGQSVVNDVQAHLMDKITLSATGLTPNQVVQAVFSAEQTPENNTQVAVPTVTPTGTTQNAGNLQFLAGIAPVPSAYGLVLDLTNIIYPANTILANYNTAMITVTNTSGGTVRAIVFGNNAPVGYNSLAQAVEIPDNGTYQYAIPIVGVTAIYGECSVSADVIAYVVLTEETVTNPAMLGWDQVDGWLVPLEVDNTGAVTVNASLTIPNPLPVATVSATLAGSPYGQTAVGVTATAIAGTHTERTGLTIKSSKANTVTVYLGTDNAVTTSTGYELEPSDAVTTSEPGQIYGIVASGSVTVSWEDE